MNIEKGLLATVLLTGTFLGGMEVEKLLVTRDAKAKLAAVATQTSVIPGNRNTLPTIAGVPHAGVTSELPTTSTSAVTTTTQGNKTEYPGIECTGPLIDTTINDVKGPFGDVIGGGHSILAAMTRASTQEFFRRSIPSEKVPAFILAVVAQSNAIFPQNQPTSNLDDAPVGNTYRFATACTVLK